MSQSKVPALAGILHEAGFSWATADEICSIVDSATPFAVSSDDVASALFRWRTTGINRALGRCRTRAAQTLRGDGSNQHMDDVAAVVDSDIDAEGQLALFNTVDERNRALAAKCPQEDGR